MLLNYDASDFKPQSFDLLPAAWYTAKLVEGEEKPTAKGNGDTYYSAQFEVIGGDFNGRKLFHNFNFNNSNPEAKRIAFEQLGAICHALGIMKVQSMDQLMEKPLQVKVKVKAAQLDENGAEKYEARNEIKGFKAVETGGAVQGSALPAGFGGESQGNGGGLPEGFTAGATVTPQAQVQEAVTQSPVTASAPVVPTATAAAPTYRMIGTAKANGLTPEQFREHDKNWTDELLVEHGYFDRVEVAPEAPKAPTAPSAPTAPTSPAATATAPDTSTVTQTSAPASAEDDDTPPWEK